MFLFYFLLLQQSRLSLSRAAAASMERGLDITSLFSPLPGMGVGMNVTDMSSYSHYPSHYSYQVSNSNKKKTNRNSKKNRNYFKFYHFSNK